LGVICLVRQALYSNSDQGGVKISLPETAFFWYAGIFVLGFLVLYIIFRLHKRNIFLETQNKILELIQKSNHLGTWNFKTNTKALHWSKEMYELFMAKDDLPQKELAAAYNQCLHPEDKKKVEHFKKNIAKTNQAFIIEYRVILPDGEEKFYREAGEGEARPSKMRADQFGYVQDISNFRHQEQSLKQSILEKEILLKELYHRTKNNMFLISALLSLFADDTENQEVKQAFSEMNNRIQSMALVHHILYQSQNLTQVDLADYIPELLNQIKQNSLFPKQAHCVTFIPSIFVTVETALPLGLLLDEILSLIMLYSFPKDFQSTDAQIEISLEEKDAEISCKVKNNGLSLVNFLSERKLRMRKDLIHTLVRDQLKGSLDFALQGDTIIDIRIPRKNL